MYGLNYKLPQVVKGFAGAAPANDDFVGAVYFIILA